LDLCSLLVPTSSHSCWCATISVAPHRLHRLSGDPDVAQLCVLTCVYSTQLQRRHVTCRVHRSGPSYSSGPHSCCSAPSSAAPQRVHALKRLQQVAATYAHSPHTCGPSRTSNSMPHLEHDPVDVQRTDSPTRRGRGGAHPLHLWPATLQISEAIMIRSRH
jgi:hypothetical protein